MKIASPFAFALISALLLPVGANAQGAGTFDGQWSGETSPVATCGPASITFEVKDSKVRGSIKGERGRGELTGTIEPDGSALISAGTQRLGGNWKFSGDTFSGKQQTFCGIPEVRGKRDRD